MYDVYLRPWTFVITFYTLACLSLAVTLPNGEYTQRYIDNILKQFDQDPQSFRHCPVIHPPLPPLGSNREHYFLPKLLLWSPQEQFQIPMKCPLHGKELRPYQWTSDISGKHNENGRLIFDYMGNIILVQRIYLCVHGRMNHKLRSTTSDIHETLPKYIQEYFPAQLFQRCGFTKALINLIETDITKGVNFFQISEGLASLNFRDFSRRNRIYASATLNSTAVDVASNSSDFYSNPIYSFPSSDQIIRFFLATFEKKKLLYSEAMESLPSSILSCDHTFKISRNVGLVRETDSKFVTQFKQLFVSLNEIGEVVAWKLTKSTALSEVEDLLIDLKKRNLVKGKTLKLVCVDDCCHVRNKYEKIFPGVDVKLDLFHTCQRITKTFTRGNALHNDITRDFIQIFRDNNDLGETRIKYTPSEEQIEKNLNSFHDRWINVPSSPLTSATQTELENLRQHIRKGCLSCIPPGCGTERNEQLHRLLNRSMITGASIISVELAIALLTVIFYQHNKKISALKHECNSKVKPVAPVETCINDDNLHRAPFCTVKNVADNTTPSQYTESNQPTHESPMVVTADNVEDLFQESIAASILTVMCNLQQLINNIGSKNCDRSFNALDIIHLINMSDILTVEENSEIDDPTINSQTETLNRHLGGFNLEIDAIQPDGDCASRSVVRQATKRACNEPQISAHLRSLGLLIDDDRDTFTLRQLFVDELLTDSGAATSFLEGSAEDKSRRAEGFRVRGVFDRDIGDLVIKVGSSIIRVPVIVITSSRSVPVVPFTPDEPLTNQPIYIAYHYYGAGHYDANNNKISVSQPGESRGCYCGRQVKSRDQLSCNAATTSKSRCPCVLNKRLCEPRKCKCKCLNCANKTQRGEKVGKSTSCRCGESKKSKFQGTENSSCVDIVGKRRTKCPCYAIGKACDDHCSCYSCGNSYGKKEESKKDFPSRKRKMVSSPPSLKRTRTSKVLGEQGFEINWGKWTIVEACLLETVESFLCTTNVLPTYQNITKMYNFVANSNRASHLKLNVNPKTEKQVLGKLNFKHSRHGALENLFYGLS